MKKIALSILSVVLFLFLVVVGLAAGKFYRHRQEAKLNNVVFESSDGVWMDSTDNLKGRRFDSVVWTFEAYKYLENKPDVTMVRITPRKEGAKDLTEWKVPMGVSSGKARAYISLTKTAQREEIFRRAKAAVEFWEKK